MTATGDNSRIRDFVYYILIGSSFAAALLWVFMAGFDLGAHAAGFSFGIITALLFGLLVPSCQRHHRRVYCWLTLIVFLSCNLFALNVIFGRFVAWRTAYMLWIILIEGTVLKYALPIVADHFGHLTKSLDLGIKRGRP